MREQFRGKEEEIERLVEVKEALESQVEKGLEEKRMLEKACVEAL